MPATPLNPLSLQLCASWLMASLPSVQAAVSLRFSKKQLLSAAALRLHLACHPSFNLRLPEYSGQAKTTADGGVEPGEGQATLLPGEGSASEDWSDALQTFLEWVRGNGIPDFSMPGSAFQVGGVVRSERLSVSDNTFSSPVPPTATAGAGEAVFKLLGVCEPLPSFPPCFCFR